MARRTNFIDGNDSFREQNLRFVRNEFEDNMNQFFGGANPSGNTQQQQAPPRDALIVQPTPDGHVLDTRRQFLRQLGASPKMAHALAVRTLEVPNFDLLHFQRRRYRLSAELGDGRQPDVDAVVLQSIGTLLEKSKANRNQSRPRTPSPPRNINWHNSRDISPQQIERSRPRTRNDDDNIRGRPRGAPVPRENLPTGPRNEVTSPGRRDDFPPAPRMNVPQGRRNDVPPGRRDVPQVRRNDSPTGQRMNVPQGHRNDVPPARRDAPAARRNDASPAPRMNLPEGRSNDAPPGRRNNSPRMNLPQSRKAVVSPGRSDAVPPANVPQGRRNDAPPGRRDAFPPGPKANVPPARRNDRINASPAAARKNLGRKDAVPSGPRENVPLGGRAPAAPPGPRAAIPTASVAAVPNRGKPIVAAAAGPRKPVPPARLEPFPAVGRTQAGPQHPSEVAPAVRGKPGPPMRGKPGRGKPGAAGPGRGPPNQGKPSGPLIRGKPGPPDRRNNIQGPGREEAVPPGRRPAVRRDNSQGFVEHERSPPRFGGARNDSYPNNRPDRYPNNRNENFEMNNRGMDEEFCDQRDFNDPRFNHAQRGPGPDDFLVNQRQNIEHGDDDDDDDDFQRQQQHGFDRPQPPAPFMGHPNTELFDSEPNFGRQQQQSRNMGGRPQIGNNYQRIFHNDQVTILRTDLLDRNVRHFDRNQDNFGPNDRDFEGNFRDREPRFNDDRDGRQFMDEERFRGQQQVDNFGEQSQNWRFNNRDMDRHDNFDNSLERNDPHNRDVRFNLNNEPNDRDLRFNLSNDDHDAYRRERNDRNDQGFIDDNCRDRMMFNDSGPGPYQSNQHRFSGGDHRFENDRDFDRQQLEFDGNFNQSNNQQEFDTFPNDFQPNQYQDNFDLDFQGRGDHRSLDRGYGYRKTNALNQERNTARNINPGGSNQARQGPRNVNAIGPNQNRTNAAADRAGNAPRNPNPAARASGPNPSTIPAKGDKNTSAANPVASAANQVASTSMQTRIMSVKPPEANPRAGQKRVAGDAPQPTVGVETKRRKTIKGKCFKIGGKKLPYVVNYEKLPQPEEESYAVTFFEQIPNYNTNVFANEDGIVVEEPDSGDDSSDSEVELLETTKGSGRHFSKSKTQKRLRTEWTVLYRKSNYKDWHNWWTDYKWCGHEINKVLEKFDNRNLQNRFLPLYNNKTTEEVINRVLRLGNLGLEKNTFLVQRNMRAIFMLMNETFLANLQIKHIEQLEKLIRRVPNHLWLYKLRSMVYLWAKYQQILKEQPKNISKSCLNGYAKKWKTPMFHWLAKQAFDELKAISEISWPDHNKFYPGIKKPIKK
ncbi:uncharacterized protein LOC117902178 isoform X1 [Drosophila subobscura]|uniref:uncharacterized protein LOC117902178 isoform X1 n=1 Tax=Drosophila subobscura TaxID=7241 RepID=UPI00155AA010|nr:uncharacterized protein LOC117902178 isoform X1 [Drosophila subobscura]